MVKLWHRDDEWLEYAACVGDQRFIGESSSDDSELEDVCAGCRVRPECIGWALEPQTSVPLTLDRPKKFHEESYPFPRMGVFVAGVRLPCDESLIEVRECLRDSLPGEIEARGEDV